MAHMLLYALLGLYPYTEIFSLINAVLQELKLYFHKENMWRLCEYFRFAKYSYKIMYILYICMSKFIKSASLLFLIILIL